DRRPPPRDRGPPATPTGVAVGQLGHRAGNLLAGTFLTRLPTPGDGCRSATRRPPPRVTTGASGCSFAARTTASWRIRPIRPIRAGLRRNEAAERVEVDGEARRGDADDLTVGADPHGASRANLDVPAPAGTHLGGVVVTADDDAGHDPDEAQGVGGLEGEEAELAVVDLGIVADETGSAEVAAVADGDAERAELEGLAVDGDGGAERSEAANRLRGGDGVGEGAEAAFEVAVELAGQLGSEADVGDVEEQLALHVADVDRARGPLHDHLGGGAQVEGEAEGAGEVVGGAAGQDADGE